jgi:NADH dehydrogenase
MKSIAILGGSGFVGEYIIDELLESGYSVKIIKRKQSASYPKGGCVEVVVDLYSEFLHEQLHGCDCVIYNIGIIREFPNRGISFKDLHQDLAIHVIDMAQKAGVRKFILMTANGVDRCLTDYEKTKFKSEVYLMKSELEWSIFRPSVIFGDPKGKMEFCTQVKRNMVKIPFPLPMFFSGINIFRAGLFRMSPIHVRNVAQFFVGAIDKEDSNQRIYELGGTTSYSWAEMIRTISGACGKRKWSMPIPIRVVKLFAFFFDRFSWFPITQGQLTMLIQGNVCDSYKHYSDFNIDEINFDIRALKYLS